MPDCEQTHMRKPLLDPATISTLVLPHGKRAPLLSSCLSSVLVQIQGSSAVDPTRTLKLNPQQSR